MKQLLHRTGRVRVRVRMRVANSFALVGVFLLSAMLTTLHAQAATPSPAPKVALQLPARLSPQTRAAIERLADSLKSVGLPFELLYDKAAEGVLKNAPDASILAATRTLAREIGTASSLLPRNAPVNDVVSAASALRAGVPVSAVQKLVNRRAKANHSDETLALSLIILVDFASRGVPMDAAVNVLDGLLAKGATGAELTTFRTGVERDLSAGRDIGTTLTTRAEGVLRRR